MTPNNATVFQLSSMFIYVYLCYIYVVSMPVLSGSEKEQL